MSQLFFQRHTLPVYLKSSLVLKRHRYPHHKMWKTGPKAPHAHTGVHSITLADGPLVRWVAGGRSYDGGK